MKTNMKTTVWAALLLGLATSIQAACCQAPAATTDAAQAAPVACAVDGKGAAACATAVVEPASAPAATYGEIDTAALAALVMAKTPMVILDARSGKWDDGKRIIGAKQLGANTTAEQAAALIPAKDALVVVYCSNLKCPASKMLAHRLLELGYTNLLKYPQGIEEWIATGHAVDAAPAK